MMLRGLLGDEGNDYSDLEDRYRGVTGAELVLDPFGTYAERARITRSASVLVCAHDAGDTLARALASIASSSFNVRRPDLLEVVVVDDGSTDGTWDLLASLELDLRLICVRQGHAGLEAARATALAHASADVAVFADAGLVHTPFALEELMRRHEILPGVALLGFVFGVDADESRAPREIVPAFWDDPRVTRRGEPAHVCRDTDHLKLLGRGRVVSTADGDVDLPALAGPFFSVERRLLIAGEAVPGLRVVPVYGAAAARVGPEPPPGSGAGVVVDRLDRAPAGVAYPELPVVYPWHEDAHAGHALVAWTVGRYEDAERLYALAAVDEPRSPWPHVGRARALRELGDHVRAADELAQAQARDPGNTVVAWELALSAAVAGRYADARDALRRAAGSPDAEWASSPTADEHKQRGDRHAAQGLHRLALRDYDLSLALDDAEPWTHYNRGAALRALGRAAEGLAAVARADELLPGDDGNRTWIHSALGELQLDLGRHTAAKVELERARRLLPHNHVAAAALERLGEETERASGIVCTLPLLRQIADIDGWLTDEEADLLSASVRRAAPLGGTILELGSFQGRSTVTIARTLLLLGADNPFVAVDPHEWVDGGGNPSYGHLLRNLERNGVADRVRVVRAASHELEWDEPLALLFVDAMHDYDSVRRDHEAFERHIVPGGLIAFHDYDPRWPDVVRYVDEVMSRGVLELAAHRENLIVLRRPALPAAGQARESASEREPVGPGR